MAAKDTLGQLGEQLAAEYLVRAGYRILDRNWRCPIGEIDIVAHDGTYLVFVEVKTRTSVAFGHPFDAITHAKRVRLRQLAGAWCAAMNPSASLIRIDAVAVIAPRGRNPRLEHLRAVI